ncbi:uncharacterized protein GGS22DRAFT_94429 [Annulohypoxylon maeteangense]|uniref:uncharacterized protein n=1 Tax=Annulohypoxylon maeteangense TaxID=1927788 RepID=UPI0020082CD4|nr:uncharacterized protein GGS22DRAFT_94429 [Annulohypoxylon maeteangense]KAI0888196.1 hypothetical protein GGS22DRAFT_94429 [Annulohypoxylon maeteangense]
MMPARSGADPEAQWPPRSPHDVLLSTPGGRERLRRMAERASPSPSPSKRSRITPILLSRSSNSRRNIVDDLDTDMRMDVDEAEDEDDEEDEEMLQLKLQAIQAKLKLKKLQSAKAKKASGGDATLTRTESNPIPDISITSRARSQTESVRPRPTQRSRSQTEIQVPVSPVRRAPVLQPDSPSRVRLGIDKGIKAKDISLKRAPSLRKTTENSNGSQGGGYLRRAHTPSFTNAEQSTKQERPMTFSERLAAARTEEQSRQEKRERIKQVRTNAFELGRQEMEQFKSNATEIPDVPIQPEQFSHEEVMAGSRLRRSNTVPSLRRPTQDENRSESSLGGVSDSQPSQNKKVSPSEVPEEETSAFEPYSAVHLSKRVIPHPVLTRNLSGKKTYVIKDLLKHVKAPEFQLPEIEQDIVVFGILASKSEPRSHKTSNHNLKEKAQTDPAKGKYMVLQLVDLQWELELFLFNSGFDRYWKLTPGTLLAVLNPNIMPPPPGRTDTGRFSLVINSGQDTILEIGTARDLGFCKSIKKDGELCNGWVNRKRTEFCEFHMNMGLAKHRQARQDVNAFNTGLGPRKDRNASGSGGGRGGKNSYRLHDWEAHLNDPKKKSRGNYDRSTGSQWFINKPSAASMLDNEIVGGHVANTVERSEALRRRLVTEEKERELMKTLGKIGSGAGKEYMQKGGTNTSKNGGTSTPGALGWGLPSDEQPRQDADAKTLGLVRPKGSELKMHLSPVKRKRSDNSSFSLGFSSSTSGGTASGSKPALGWGGGLRDKLSRMKEGERLRPASSFANSSSVVDRDRDVSGTDDGGGGSGSGGNSMRPPARKKTRFVTAKGIREAGRESLGGELGSADGDASASTDLNTVSNSGGRQRRMVVLDEDDDDELEILR